MTEEELISLYKNCMLCPRGCGADRYKKTGFCRAGTRPRLAKAMLHLWEEPVLCSAGGSGAVFFSGCTMRCVYCQNYRISAEGFGKDISISELSDIFLRLQDKGAQNIDLITASHFLPSVIAALDKVKSRLHIPIVYNCGGYESPETIGMLDGYIDIYLPDVKYFDDALARRCSLADDYFKTACAALGEMIRQTGKPVVTEDLAVSHQKTECEHMPGPVRSMKRGVIVRHMLLPSHREDSVQVLRGLADRFGTDKFLISLLRQYTPFYLAKTDPAYRKINRRIASYEYDYVVNEAIRLGFDGFVQEKSSAAEEYTPIFDLQGVGSQQPQ